VHCECRLHLLQHTATCCNTLQHAATHFITPCVRVLYSVSVCVCVFVSECVLHLLQHTATYCNTLKQTTTHCVCVYGVVCLRMFTFVCECRLHLLPHTKMHYNTLYNTATHRVCVCGVVCLRVCAFVCEYNVNNAFSRVRMRPVSLMDE